MTLMVPAIWISTRLGGSMWRTSIVRQIKVLDANGTLILKLGSGRKGMGPGQFNRLEGVTIHGQDVWFSDTYNDRIVRYRISD